MDKEIAHLLEYAWGIIANAGEGNWEKESKTWQEAAAKWRDQYEMLRAVKEEKSGQ